MSEPEDEDGPPGPEIPNAADPTSIAKRTRKGKLEADNRSAFWIRTMDDPTGRLVVWEILTDLGTFEDRFAATPAGFPDQAARDFYAGQKSYGQRLYRTLMVATPARIIEMHQEHDAAFQIHRPPRKKLTDG